MLVAKTLSEIMSLPEGVGLDWKREFPPGLLTRGNRDLWEAGKGTILKDVVALANGETNSVAYLILGVVDEGHSRTIVGLNQHWDDAVFQTWFANVFEPAVRFHYYEIEMPGAKVVGVFEIEPSPEYPHVAVRTVGDVVFEGQVWFRRGTQNALAKLADLRRMIRGEEPFKIGQLGDPELVRITKFYEAKGERVVLPRASDKDSKLANGFKIAYYPNTRREVWVGEHNGLYEHILLVAPPSGN